MAPTLQELEARYGGVQISDAEIVRAARTDRRPDKAFVAFAEATGALGVQEAIRPVGEGPAARRRRIEAAQARVDAAREVAWRVAAERSEVLATLVDHAAANLRFAPRGSA